MSTYSKVAAAAAAAAALFCLKASAQQICNNAAKLCDRSYDNITHLGAHDAAFVRDSANLFTPAGNQFYNATTQLDAGIRLLSAQAHNFTNADGDIEVHLCHTNCLLYDAGTLESWLASIKTWLDNNHNDVVTILIVNSDNNNAETLGNIYSEAGMSNYSYTPAETTQPMNASWPTLNELIADGKRLVNFVASLDPVSNTVAPYLLDEFTFIFENQYDVTDPSNFSCVANRPSSVDGKTSQALAAGLLPLMNHFLDDEEPFGIEIPSVENADNTNAFSGTTGNLGAAAANCSDMYGRAPPFILVDFANVGPALATVDFLNGVEGQTTGRLALPSTVLATMLQD